MTVNLDVSKFPLITLTLSAEPIHDIDIVKSELNKVFKISKKNKTKVSVVIESGEFEGFGLVGTVQLVKYLLEVRDRITKYFNRCCIIMEDDEGMFSYILSIYTPARPLELFKTTRRVEALEWVTTVNG